jgi:hypothetical protein
VYIKADFGAVLLNAKYLDPIPRDEDGFSRLKLPDGHKQMVQSLVIHHMNEMNVRSTKGDSHEYDIVRGKGRGLIVLLHGAPGVGKTSTAGKHVCLDLSWMPIFTCPQNVLPMRVASHFSLLRVVSNTCSLPVFTKNLQNQVISVLKHRKWRKSLNKSSTLLRDGTVYSCWMKLTSF